MKDILTNRAIKSNTSPRFTISKRSHMIKNIEETRKITRIINIDLFFFIIGRIINPKISLLKNPFRYFEFGIFRNINGNKIKLHKFLR